MRSSGASPLRGLPCKKGGCPPLLNCSRPALLLMTCLECGDWGDGMRGVGVSTSPPVQGARALGHVALQWACECKLREGGREAVWVVRARETKPSGPNAGSWGCGRTGDAACASAARARRESRVQKGSMERVVSAKIPLNFRVQRSGE